MRITLFHNPTSGDAKRPRSALVRMLRDAGYEVSYQSTDEAWQTALQREADLFVVAGGDGTITKVVKRLGPDSPPWTPLPMGTANNIAKSLGIIGSLEAIAEGWTKGRVQPFDLGLLRTGSREERFVECWGGGPAAELMRRGKEGVESGVIAGRETDRALTLLLSIVDEAVERPWEISIDGDDVSGDYAGVEVMNTNFVGPNVPLAPDADVGDGSFEVALLGADERAALIEYLGSRLGRATGTAPGIHSRRGRKVRVRPPRGMPLHLDDTARSKPADGERVYELELLPAMTRVRIPDLPRASA